MTERNRHETPPPFCLIVPLLAGLIAGPAYGQQPACTNRADVVAHLAKKYGEVPVSMGLANNGGMIEVLASPNGESWTIMITMPNGTSCMIAAGESWERLEIKPMNAGAEM